MRNIQRYALERCEFPEMVKNNLGDWVSYSDLLEITDHLQKTIEAQDRVGSNTLLAVIKMTEERDQARRLAEKLRNDSERPGGGHTWLPWENR